MSNWIENLVAKVEETERRKAQETERKNSEILQAWVQLVLTSFEIPVQEVTNTEIRGQTPLVTVGGWSFKPTDIDEFRKMVFNRGRKYLGGFRIRHSSVPDYKDCYSYIDFVNFYRSIVKFHEQEIRS